MKIIEWLTSAWNWIKKGLSALGVFAVLIVGVALGRLLSPSEIVEVPTTKYYEDSTQIKAQSEVIADLQEDKVSLLNRIFALEKSLKPSDVIIADDPSPLEPIIVERVVRDTIIKHSLYPYDFIYYGIFTPDSVVFMTLNPYVESKGENFVKRYFYRNKGWDELEFTLTQSISTKEIGIVFHARRPFLAWDGIHAGLGASFEGSPYLWLDARLRFYGLELRPVFRSEPYLGLEAGVRLW